MRKFVVTGIGRSATKYTSALLTASGIPATWETAFRVNKRALQDTGGDSSWLSAPFLSELPADTVILHQTRDPLKWLQSWLRSTVRWPREHIQFVNEHSKLFRWDRIARPQADMLVWVRWNKMIEAQVKAGGFPYLRYRVEDLDLAKMEEIAKMVEAPFSTDKAVKALETVSKKTNTSDVPKSPNRRVRLPVEDAPAAKTTPLTWAGLPAGSEIDAFKALAVEYGYGVTDE